MLLLTRDFDGHMTLVSMGVAWTVFAVMSARLLWLVRTCVLGARPVTRYDASLAAVFLAAATGGTVLTFDASLPWVYHEVYLWSAALVVSALYWMVRVALDPTPLAMRWLGLVALCTALTRTPAGWGVCLALLVLAAWMRWGRTQTERRDVARVVLALGAVPLAVAIAINLAKFGHVYLFPLDQQVWTHVNAHRREALRVNGGTIAGPQFFLTSLVNYFRPDGIRFVDYFPYITLPARPAHAYGGAFLDQSYRTGSVTDFMTLLLALTLGSFAVVFRRGLDLAHRALRPALLAGLLVGGGVMGYGYVTYRYTSEFVPLLVIGGAIGLCGAVELLGSARRWLTWPLTGLTAVLVAFAIAANMLTGTALAAQTWRGQKLVDYVGLQASLSPGAVAGLVTHSDTLPRGGRTDQLHIRGDCQALYENTGDAYEPWVVVEERDQIAEVTTARHYSPATVGLFTVRASHTRTVSLQLSSSHRGRVVIDGPEGRTKGFWFELPGRSSVRIGLRTLSDLGYVEVTSTPGGFAGFVPIVEWSASWHARPGTVDYDLPVPRTASSLGLTVEPLAGVPLPLCVRLARDAGLQGAR
jgi:hypothetical protein